MLANKKKKKKNRSQIARMLFIYLHAGIKMFTLRC